MREVETENDKVEIERGRSKKQRRIEVIAEKGQVRRNREREK